MKYWSDMGIKGVFVAAVSPIPYKLLAWTAGAGRMDLKPFVLAGIFGRGIRFGLQALLIGVWGDEFMKHLDNPPFWILVCVFFVCSVNSPEQVVEGSGQQIGGPSSTELIMRK